MRNSEDLPSDEAFVRRHAGPLLATARRLLGNGGDAAGAVQEGFTQFLKTHAPLTCLKGFVIRAALKRLDTARRPAPGEIEELLPRFDASGASALVYEDWGDVSADASVEVLAAVRAAVDQLPGIARLVFLLCDVEGLGAAEASDHLGLSPLEVEATRHRARQALRRSIAPLFERVPAA